MVEPIAEALAAFRAFNYESVYLRPASTAQASAVIAMLRALVEHYADRPNLLARTDDGYAPDQSARGVLHGVGAASPEAYAEAVRYVGGMTDRFACQQAV
ncbi:MAG TPA: deoxyguanosinetriphosphate triphosphohydrolase, partial [Ilumatobacteraceae bacterium]|nr:deoxyguanosinetriphosphate triphosphohydrolase [Ilumatobacteraceae bacterium]